MTTPSPHPESYPAHPSHSTHPAVPRELPQGWRWAKLGDVCKFTNGDAYKESDWSTEGLPIIRIQNLNDQSKPFNYWRGGVTGRVTVSNGDLLLAWSGTPGTSFGAHIWSRGEGLLNQHIFNVETASGLDKEWARSAINHALDGLIRAAHGAVGLAHVTRREVDALLIPLPPLPEQRRIAVVLTEQMAAIEKARAAAKERLDTIRVLSSAMIARAFPCIGRPLPNGWGWSDLVDIADLLPSRSLSSTGTTDVHAVTSACLTEEGFSPAGVKKARMSSMDAKVSLLSAGEVLVARSNTAELVGRASLYDGYPAGIVGTDLTIRVFARISVNPQFLSFYLSNLYMSGYWRDHAGGASGSMKKITRTQVAALRVPLPSLPEQQQIAARLQNELVAVRSACNSAESELATINALPAALLRRAFNGEI